MHLSHNPAQTILDNQSIEHWAKAMGIPGTRVFIEPQCDNVLTYAERHHLHFKPDYDEDGVLIANERVENFRRACVYETLANLLDIAENLDDDATDSIDFYHRLVANDHDSDNVPSWLSHPYRYSLTLRTYQDAS